ncbi:CoA transferase [Naumannella sp. ID2617S]|nr:CoA transferase [Naumannella sp. ID2617S]
MTDGPLDGIRVVELAGIGPSPYACLVLAELGAEVIRVDRPGPGVLPVGSGCLNRSRPSVALDLRTSTGREAVLRLVERADVLVEGLRPGTCERLGLGPEDCRTRNPTLVYARMTGWGQHGPLAHTAGHDINFAAVAGALHLCGPAERPIPPVNLVADFGGGSLFLVTGILAGLLQRHRTGRGTVVDAAMVDGTASMTTMLHGLLADGAWTDRREANFVDGGAPFYRCYECADGRFVAVGALEPQFFAVLCESLGVHPATEQNDRSGWPAMTARFATAFATRTRDAWAEHFADTDACVSPVLSLAEAPQHPHLQARGTFGEVDGHPAPRIAPRFDDAPPPDPTPEPRRGADTRAALTEWGFAALEIDALLATGAAHQN